MQSLRSGGKTVMALALVIVWGPAAFAQQTPAGRGRGQAAAPATTGVETEVPLMYISFMFAVV